MYTLIMTSTIMYLMYICMYVCMQRMENLRIMALRNGANSDSDSSVGKSYLSILHTYIHTYIHTFILTCTHKTITVTYVCMYIYVGHLDGEGIRRNHDPKLVRARLQRIGIFVCMYVCIYVCM